METARSAIPITDADLDALEQNAENLISRIGGSSDIEALLRSLAPEETYRTLPIELDLVYTIRHAVCLYVWMGRWLITHTGQAEEAKNAAVPTDSIMRKQRFSSSYALFVMSSAIVRDCEGLLKGKNADGLATIQPNYKFEPGRNFSQDLQIMLSYYAECLRSDNGNGIPLVKNANDLVSLTRDFWRSVGERALNDAKKADASIQATVLNCTFKNDDFVIAGFSLEAETRNSSASFVPVMPEEVVGNNEAVIMMLRLADRIALYNVKAKRNPFCEVGGLYESFLVDGPPGTGKTTIQRMMMTRLAHRSEQVAIPYVFKSLDASSIKSEWYGKAGKLLSEILTIILNPDTLGLLCLDDIDLLLSNRDDPGSGGADKDLLKGLMDFFSGIGTNYRGNYTSAAATNKPTGVDDALRQRFVYRVLVNGAENWQDYADLVALQLRKPLKLGLAKVITKDYQPLSRTRATHLLSPMQKAESKINWTDIGKFIEELHSKNSAFTARTVKNAMDVVIAKASDFDIPEEFYTKPSEFKEKSWDDQVNIVKNLFSPITAQAIMDSLQDQFDSEARYATARYVNK